jgi:hypothetical protein
LRCGRRGTPSLDAWSAKRSMLRAILASSSTRLGVGSSDRRGSKVGTKGSFGITGLVGPDGKTAITQVSYRSP